MGKVSFSVMVVVASVCGVVGRGGSLDVGVIVVLVVFSLLSWVGVLWSCCYFLLS